MSLSVMHVLANCRIKSIEALLGDFVDLRLPFVVIVVEPFVIGINILIITYF